MAFKKKAATVVRYVNAGASRARAAAPIVIRTTGRGLKRAGKAVGSAAADEKHTLFAIGAAAALGYMQKSGIAFPTIPVLGTSGTAGLVAFAGAKMTKNRTLRHIATGLLCVAAHEYAKSGVVSGDVLGGRGAAWE